MTFTFDIETWFKVTSYPFPTSTTSIYVKYILYKTNIAKEG